MTSRLVLAVAAFIAGAAPVPSSLSADRLVAAVLEARMTSGFRARAKLTRSLADSNEEISRQLLITGRRDDQHTTVVYRIVSAKGPGRALLIDDDGSHQTTGVRFENGVTSALTPAMMSAPFFDTDLSVEDVVEGFWYWRSRLVVGEAVVDNRRCLVVEFRPAGENTSHYARVRAWISPELALPLQIAAFGPGDTIEKQLLAARITKRDGRWVAGRLLVEPADHHSRTLLEGTKFDGNLVLPASDFTVAAVAASLRRSD